ncbi:MAG: hypothetical protein JNJ54_26040 [Myxococcaceae bacterium]|nr:hypothetical protein [Myxococcaceae bacterium]
MTLPPRNADGGLRRASPRPVVAEVPRPKKVAGPIQVEVAPSAELDVGAVRAFVTGFDDVLRSCAERVINQPAAGVPAIDGRVVAEARVTPAGRLQGIELTSDTIRNDQFFACLKTVMRGWTLPVTPAGLVPVTITFGFSTLPG